MNPANYDSIKNGKNVLQADVSREMFINLVERSIDRGWDLTKLEEIDFKSMDRKRITFGGGVLVASDVDQRKLRNELVSRFDTIFPMLSDTFDREMDYLADVDDWPFSYVDDYPQNKNVVKLNKSIEKFIEKNLPARVKNNPIDIKFNSNDLSFAAMIFSFVVLDIPWMYMDVDDTVVNFKPPTTSTSKGEKICINGFKIPELKCGVGIFRPGIQVTRFRVCSVRNEETTDAASEYKKRTRLTDVWNPKNIKKYCTLSPEYVYLHIFHTVENADMNSIRDDQNFKIECKSNERAFPQDGKNLLARPKTENMTKESISKLYESVFENEKILEQSLKLDLPKKLARFSMPNVEIDVEEHINQMNAEDYGIPKTCFNRPLKNLVSSGGYLGAIKSRTKLKIDKEGVALSSAVCGLAFDGGRIKFKYNVEIDQPFCFAITVGDYIIARGMYVDKQ